MKNNFSRRQFLSVGFFLSSGLLLSCSKKSDQDSPLVALYDSNRVLISGVPQRIPFAILDGNNLGISDETVLPVAVRFNSEILDELTVKAHLVEHDHFGVDESESHQHSDFNRYFPLRYTFDQPGVYDLVVDLKGEDYELNVQIFDPQDVKLPAVGDNFPKLKTPVDGSGEKPKDSLGLDLICSREPACGLHSTSVDSLVGVEPFAMLVATPAYCATSYCGPVLDTLLGAKFSFKNINFIHTEVYKNPLSVDGYEDPRIKTADYIDELNLNFEPCLYLVNEKGVVADRLDNIFDIQELRSSLEIIN